MVKIKTKHDIKGCHFFKGNERYLLFCPNWMFLLLEKWLLRVNQRKERKAPYFPVVFVFLWLDSEAYLHTPESSFAYQTHIKAHGACSGEMEELCLNPGLMRRPGGAQDDKLSSHSASCEEAALSPQVLQVENMKRWCSVYSTEVDQLFIKN